MRAACCRGLDAIIGCGTVEVVGNHRPFAVPASLPRWAVPWYLALSQLLYDFASVPASLGKQNGHSREKQQVLTDLVQLSALVGRYGISVGTVRAALNAYYAHAGTYAGLCAAVDQLRQVIMQYIAAHPNGPGRAKRPLVGASSSGGPYLVMHIDDPKALVAHEKGSGIAWASMALLPEFVTNKIYDAVKQQMTDQFREKGSDVSISVVQTAPAGEKPTSDLKGGVILGVLLSALGYGALKLVRRK